MNWDELMDYELFSIGKFSLQVGNLFMALVVGVITWGIVLFLRKLILQPRFIMDKIDNKRRMSIFLITKYFIWIVSIIIMLDVIGVQLTVILVGSTALLVGLGLGLQNIFTDLVSGIFLLFEGTVKVGDVIEADGVVGKIVDINLRSTQVITRDDVTIIIPNSKFIVEKVVNWSHSADRVRFDVKIGLAYGSDVTQVVECLESAMQENKLILEQPKPFVRFTDFGESALEFQLIFWSMETFRIENLKSDLRKVVYQKLQDKNLVIPFPQRDVHIKGLDALLAKRKG